MTRRPSYATQREELWKSEAGKARRQGRGEYPICQLCQLAIKPGDRWDENHEAHKPKWLGGVVDGISHKRCNRLHNNEIDTPLYAKNERVRKKHLDFVRPRHPMQGGRDDRIKKKMSGRVVNRATGREWGTGR